MNIKTISGKEDLSEDPYQLSIIINDTKDFTAPELISAVAIAVADFAPVRQELDDREPNWKPWLEGRFRKIIKRLKPALFNKLSVNLQEDQIEHFIVVGKIDLIIIAPQPKSFQPSYLKRAQLSGLSVLDSQLPGESDCETVVLINSQSAMSISKTAVSAAHALQIAKQIAYDSDSKTLVDWCPSRAGFIWAELDDNEDTEYTAEVVDAGLTEVDPGTRTAAVIIR